MPFGRQPTIKHEREGWEIPYFIGAFLSVTMLTVGLTSRPKTSIKVLAPPPSRNRAAQPPYWGDAL